MSNLSRATSSFSFFSLAPTAPSGQRDVKSILPTGRADPELTSDPITLQERSNEGDGWTLTLARESKGQSPGSGLRRSSVDASVGSELPQSSSPGSLHARVVRDVAPPGGLPLSSPSREVNALSVAGVHELPVTSRVVSESIWKMRDLVPLIGAYCGGTLAQARADMQNFLIARGASEQDARAYVQPLDLLKIFFGYSKDFFWMIPDHGAGMKHFFEFNKYANPTNTLRRIIPSEMVPDALFLRGRPLDARWSKELVVPEMLMLTIARQFEDAGLEPSDNLEKLFFEEGLRRDKRVIRLVPEPLLRQIADQDFMENALKEFPDLARHIPEDMLSQESWVSAAIESIKGRDFVALDGIPSECLLAAAQALASGVNNGAMRRLTEYLDYIRVHPEIPRRLTHQVQTEIQAALLEESMPSGNRGKGKQCVIR